MLGMFVSSSRAKDEGFEKSLLKESNMQYMLSLLICTLILCNPAHAKIINSITNNYPAISAAGSDAVEIQYGAPIYKSRRIETDLYNSKDKPH